MEWPISGEKGQSGSGTLAGYSVEARFAYREPREVFGMLFDNRWKRIEWRENVGGAGNPRPYFRNRTLDELGLMTLTEAEALRWNFLCHAEASGPGGAMCFETRLVRHAVEYSRSAKPVAYLRAMDARGDIPADMRTPLQGDGQ